MNTHDSIGAGSPAAPPAEAGLPAGVFVGNAWVEPASGRRLAVESPADGLPFAEIADGGAADIDRAVRAARAAFDGGEWGRLPALERGRLLGRLSALVLRDFEGLAALEARDTGKPMAQARADITAAARYFEFYAGAADKLHGEAIPTVPGVLAVAERVPLGVTGHIIPWNYPAQMVGRSIGGSLAAGNAVVLKPAEDACLSTLRIAELTREAGFPDGAVGVVPGRGETAGAALAAHPGIDFLSFTGSPEVGAMVQTAAARNHVGCTLELGGKSPQVVFADADLDAAMPVILNAIVQNAGQTCSAGARLLVEASALPAVTERLAAAFPGLVAGTPAMDRTLGPLISRRQKARVEGYIARAEADGVPVIARGAVAEGVPAGGHWVAPHAFGPVPRDHALAQEEVFGPVLALLPFADEADAVALANATAYGLVAGVWTRDGSRALRVARRIRAGQVFVNCYGAGGGVEFPFGGMKQSGHGREKGFEALRHFTTLRTMVIRHG